MYYTRHIAHTVEQLLGPLYGNRRLLDAISHHYVYVLQFGFYTLYTRLFKPSLKKMAFTMVVQPRRITNSLHNAKSCQYRLCDRYDPSAYTDAWARVLVCFT